jgi:hypothetical protein
MGEEVSIQKDVPDRTKNSWFLTDLEVTEACKSDFKKRNATRIALAARDD